MPVPTLDIVIAALFALFLIMLLGRVFFTPLRWAFKLLVNSAAGLLLLLLVNYLGAPWGFSLPVNIITVLVTGFLGLPGLILLILLRFLA